MNISRSGTPDASQSPSMMQSAGSFDNISDDFMDVSRTVTNPDASNSACMTDSEPIIEVEMDLTTTDEAMKQGTDRGDGQNICILYNKARVKTNHTEQQLPVT